MSAPSRSSELPPSDSSDDVDEDDRSVDLLAPSQDADPVSSPVQNTHALSGFIHPFVGRATSDPFVRSGTVANPYLRNLRVNYDKRLLAKGRRGQPFDDDTNESVGHQRRSSLRTRLTVDDDEHEAYEDPSLNGAPGDDGGGERFAAR